MKKFEYYYARKISRGYEYGFVYIIAESKKAARALMKTEYPEYHLFACSGECIPENTNETIHFPEV